MPTAKLVPPFLVAILVAISGAMFGSAVATGAGSVAALAVVAVHTAVTGPGVPRSTRLLVWGGLALVAVAMVVHVWGWVALQAGGAPPTSTDALIAAATDPARQQARFQRQVFVVCCLVLAVACVGVAVGRAPRARARRSAWAVPTVGAATLAVLLVVTLIPSRLAGLVGSFTDVAVVLLIVGGGYAWVVHRAWLSYGPVSFVVVGATMLTAVTWLMAESAWRSRPEPPDTDAFLQPGVRLSSAVAFGVDTGPDLEAAGTVAAVLIGVAVAGLACARLSATGSDPH